MPVKYSPGQQDRTVFDRTSGHGVQAVGAAGSRHGGWRSWNSFSKQGVGGEDLTGKSVCRWQDVVGGERRNRPGFTSLDHSDPC